LDLILGYGELGFWWWPMALRKSGGLLGGLIVSSCSQLAALWKSQLIGGVSLGFLLLLLLALIYSCWLKLVGNGENEGSLVGEGEEDEKKAISLGLVWNWNKGSMSKIIWVFLFDFQLISVGFPIYFRIYLLFSLDLISICVFVWFWGFNQLHWLCWNSLGILHFCA